MAAHPARSQLRQSGKRYPLQRTWGITTRGAGEAMPRWNTGPCAFGSGPLVPGAPVLASFLWLSVVWTRTSKCATLKCKVQTRALEGSPCLHVNMRSKHLIFRFQIDFHLASAE